MIELLQDYWQWIVVGCCTICWVTSETIVAVRKSAARKQKEQNDALSATLFGGRYVGMNREDFVLEAISDNVPLHVIEATLDRDDLWLFSG